MSNYKLESPVHIKSVPKMTCLNTKVIPIDIANLKNKNRFLSGIFKITNSFVGLGGIAILLYSVWMFVICIQNYDQDDVMAGWFLWTCSGIAALICFTACIGQVAAFFYNGVLFSFYMLFMLVLFMIEAFFTADLLLNPSWRQDFPTDPTARFDDFVAYVELHFEIFKSLSEWFLFFQISSFILALLLKAFYSICLKKFDEQVSANVPFLNSPGYQLPYYYVVGHPHPAAEKDEDNTFMDKDAMPISEKEIRLMADDKCLPC